MSFMVKNNQEAEDRIVTVMESYLADAVNLLKEVQGTSTITSFGNDGLYNKVLTACKMLKKELESMKDKCFQQYAIIEYWCSDASKRAVGEWMTTLAQLPQQPVDVAAEQYLNFFRKDNHIRDVGSIPDASFFRKTVLLNDTLNELNKKLNDISSDLFSGRNKNIEKAVSTALQETISLLNSLFNHDCSNDLKSALQEYRNSRIPRKSFFARIFRR